MGATGMPDSKPTNPRSLKIFPRNLTARADSIVRGNPTNSRPDAAVENCFPGLEIDIRNIEQNFIKGLHFEYHRDDGAILTRVTLDEHQQLSGLKEEDWLVTDSATGTKQPRLYLWGVLGRTAPQEIKPLFFSLRGQSGSEVFRRVRDLLPGRVAIVFGPVPGFNNSNPEGVRNNPDGTAERLITKTYAASNERERFITVRDKSNNLQFAVFSQERNPYFSEDGVLDVDSYAPGELTKTLCAPWIYDFRDCSCFYWSSNKPDLVESADGKSHFLNFMRKDRVSAPPPEDVAIYKTVDDNGILIPFRSKLELTYEDMIEGGWQTILPVVLNDRESVTFIPPPAPTVTRLLTREETIEELNYLATVEHALTVEYLYAYLSLKSPFGQLPNPASPEEVRIFSAAQEVLTIAVEEMRHFRWVNDLLFRLGQSPITDRATIIGAPPTPGDGRKAFAGKKFLNKAFALERLTPNTLQWFIDVEAPSQIANQQLDGMYVEILHSINEQRNMFPEADILLPIIKLIIDEGGGHYDRFLRVQELLKDISQDRYLHTFQNNPSTSQKALLTLCDGYYQSIVEAIKITFSLGNRSGGVLLKAAERTMHNLNEAAFVLTSQGYAPKFTLLSTGSQRKAFLPEEVQGVLDRRLSSLTTVLADVKSTGSQFEQTMADRHLRAIEELYQRMRMISRQEVTRP